VTKITYKIPQKRCKPARFEAVWKYLETVEAYDSILSLHAELVKQFGKNNTPSKSHLHRHLQANR